MLVWGWAAFGGLTGLFWESASGGGSSVLVTSLLLRWARMAVFDEAVIDLSRVTVSYSAVYTSLVSNASTIRLVRPYSKKNLKPAWPMRAILKEKKLFFLPGNRIILRCDQAVLCFVLVRVMKVMIKRYRGLQWQNLLAPVFAAGSGVLRPRVSAARGGQKWQRWWPGFLWRGSFMARKFAG